MFNLRLRAPSDARRPVAASTVPGHLR